MLAALLSTPMTVVLVLALCLAAAEYRAAHTGSEGVTGVQPPAPSEKDARTPAQRKINSQLLYEIYRRRGQAARKGVPAERTDVRIDGRGRALVDVRVVSPARAVRSKVRALGGTILSVSDEHHSILAWLPLLNLERLAGDSAVRFIEPAAEATTAHSRGGKR